MKLNYTLYYFYGSRRAVVMVDMEGFIEKLERLYPNIEFVNRLMTHSWGQKVIRFMIWMVI